MRTGIFQKQETRKENTAYGEMTYTFTKTITIVERSYNGRKPMLFQTEQTYRNSVMTAMHQYPASTDYAKERRQWVCDF